MRRIVIALLLTALVVTVLPTFAQDNLLTNGGLEEGEFGPYQGKGRSDLNIPAGWDLWLGQGSKDQFFNRGDKVYAFPHNGVGPSPVEGDAAASIHGGYVQFNAALFQTVSVAPETNLQAEAASQLKVCTPEDGEPGFCGSDPSSGAQTRIGIDPNGGNDPNSAEIIWSEWLKPHDTWARQYVEATATGSQVTVFLYTTQGAPYLNNFTWFDDVKLTTGGAGGTSPAAAPASTPVPTPVPYVDFVVPQDAQEDGSIMHTVTQGDTLDSIAYAYGTTRTALLEINPSLPSARWLQVGQQITVQEAPAPAEVVEADVEAEAAEDVEVAAAPEDAEAAPAEEGMSEEMDAYVTLLEEGLASNAASIDVMSVELMDERTDGGELATNITYVSNADGNTSMAQDWFTLFATIGSIARGEDIPLDMIVLTTNDEEGEMLSSVTVSTEDVFAILGGDLSGAEFAERLTVETR